MASASADSMPPQADAESEAATPTPTPSTTAADTMAPAATPTASEKTPDDSSKLRMFLGILKKFIGVADIATVRFSLPSQLLEPTPNLEYWNYLDQPSTFTAIGDSEEPLDRMLEVLRFWFTKDLKYVKGKPCKPYNSVLGEFFRCTWEVDESLPPICTGKVDSKMGSAASSIKSGQVTPKNGLALPPPQKLERPVKIAFLTEQTSHHPPVSAFHIDCPEKGVSARGFDQIAARFTGTSVRVSPGEHNLGIFINISRRDDEAYQLTHPVAYLGGILIGRLNVTVSDYCYVTCPKTRLKTILQYVEEGWLGKSMYKVEGVVFRYDPDHDTCVKIKDVAEKDILARISGNWREKLYYTLGAKGGTQNLIIDLLPLTVPAKTCPPAPEQLPNESRRFWSDVTDAINTRQFSQATALKVELEEGQRQKARAREEAHAAWQPRFFTAATAPLGRPELTPDGRDALSKMGRGDWTLEASKPETHVT